MNRFNCVVAALAVIAFVSPSLAEDASRTGPSAKTERGLPAGGQAKHETVSGQIRSDDRAGLQGESRKSENGWNRARAEVVFAHRGHHHHHRHHHHDIM
jgi:hypothetical protein